VVAWAWSGYGVGAWFVMPVTRLGVVSERVGIEAV
jgi:hypothetical protein